MRQHDPNANPYLSLDERPFINRCSMHTMPGGSLMLPQVRAAGGLTSLPSPALRAPSPAMRRNAGQGAASTPRLQIPSPALRERVVTPAQPGITG
ncbi:MAG TPA: hypothetical protein VHW66_03990 [Stellaceae bacterium]|jgi:hypothetical protein|nr:hypothetical protein [Stellaceae bacterium]